MSVPESFTQTTKGSPCRLSMSSKLSIQGEVTRNGGSKVLEVINRMKRISIDRDGGKDHRSGRLTVSNACEKSTNAIYRGSFCSAHFSWSCRKVKIMSVVPRAALKPHCDSGRVSSAIECSRFRRIFLRIFPAIDRSEIP